MVKKQPENMLSYYQWSRLGASKEWNVASPNGNVIIETLYAYES